MPQYNSQTEPRFLNRELSWLEFNDRVLREGMSDEVPLLERLKFLAIVSSNLDEFFMVRVAGLKQQVDAGDTRPDASGLTPSEQLHLVSERIHRMQAEQSVGIQQVFALLRKHGIFLLNATDWTTAQRRFLESLFASDILPVLTPLAAEKLEPFPVLSGLCLHLAVLLRPVDTADAEPKLAVVPIPPALPRFINVPADSGCHLTPIETVVAENVGRLFPGFKVEATAVFRLTRDADIEVSDDDVSDLLEAVSEAVRSRRHRRVVCLAISARPDPRILDWLRNRTEVGDEDVYETDGLLDAAALFAIANRPGFDTLKNPPWPPQPARDLIGAESIWEALQDHDVMISLPYESFDPVVQLVDTAANDPKVVAIKQTLYRTSGDSPIVAALARAAENGKQVTVLVELRARFDEARNIQWARRLEDAGCTVIYGVSSFKTHAKLLLIIRREESGIRRYVHAATGNYNDRTARLYSDIGLMTSDPDFAADASAFFNLLTGYSQAVSWTKFTISPTDSRRRIIELIERETLATTPDQPGLIMAKMNAMDDRKVAEALYEASRAGVHVRLNIRGFCCLRPGVPGLSENIEVISIVDRFLEHSRIFYFHNGGHEEIYLSSVDWRVRNFDRRFEIIFPVTAPHIRRRLISMLEIYFADNVKARRLLPDGTYVPVAACTPRVRAQEVLYQDAVESAEAIETAPLQFRPLTPPHQRSSL